MTLRAPPTMTNACATSRRSASVDEIWSFTYAKQKNVKTAKVPPEAAGDTWTWTAIDADTKLIASYLVGGRDGEYAGRSSQPPRYRVQLTSNVPGGRRRLWC